MTGYPAIALSLSNLIIVSPQLITTTTIIARIDHKHKYRYSTIGGFKMKQKCKAKNCTKNIRYKKSKLCNAHYMRWLRHGVVTNEPVRKYIKRLNEPVFED